MPDTPQYFQQLISSIHEFEGLKQDWIDRDTIEQLAGVSRSTARRILARCGAAVERGPGGLRWVKKPAFMLMLQNLKESGEWYFEEARRERVDSNLTQLADAARARAVEIARDQDAVRILSSTLEDFPGEGIRFEAGRLVVEFSGPVDLLRKLFSFVSACKNDFLAACELIEKQAGVKGS